MPDEFGKYAEWFSLVIFMSVAVTGRFEAALPIENDGDERREAVIATLITAFILSIVLGIALTVEFFLKVTFVGNFSSVFAISLVPAAFLLAASQIWVSWASAAGNYRNLSILRIVQSFAITFFQVILGLANPICDSLAEGYLIGLVIGIGFSIYLMPTGTIKLVSIRDVVLSFWRRHHRFPLYSLPADTINTAASQLPIILVGQRFGADAAGLLSMSFRVLGAPVGLLGKSVLDILKRDASVAYKERGQCRNEYVKALKLLTAIAIVFCISYFFLGEDVFLLAFGEPWKSAGLIAYILLPYFGLSIIASPLSYMVYIAGKQRWDLIWQIFLLVLTTCSLYFFDDLYTTLAVYSIVYSLLYLIYIRMSYLASLGQVKVVS